jgi:hypothetical protein
VPRFVRELRAVHETNGEMQKVRDIPASFDALVVLREGCDSTPTPTGSPKVE